MSKTVFVQKLGASKSEGGFTLTHFQGTHEDVSSANLTGKVSETIRETEKTTLLAGAILIVINDSSGGQPARMLVATISLII